jgi:hypothetical protein
MEDFAGKPPVIVLAGLNHHDVIAKLLDCRGGSQACDPATANDDIDISCARHRGHESFDIG